MDTGRWLLVSGTVLLSVSALIGFVQYRYREHPETFARWRVVHAGGTAGAVQLIALAAVWGLLRIDGFWATGLSAGLVIATWAFFLGPLAGALGHGRAAQMINRAGAVVAVPAYVLLPVVLLR
jgi:hypothetical protein